MPSAGKRRRKPLAAVSASAANTPRCAAAPAKAAAAADGKLTIDTVAVPPHMPKDVGTKLWNEFGGSYTVADSPHLANFDVGSPRAVGATTPLMASLARSATPGTPVDLSHMPAMRHRPEGFGSAAAAAAQPRQVGVSLPRGADMSKVDFATLINRPAAADSPRRDSLMPTLTPDARASRRRTALAAGQFNAGAGAVCKYTRNPPQQLDPQG